MNRSAVRWLTQVFIVCVVTLLSWIRSDAAAVRWRVEPLDHPEGPERSIWKVWRSGGCGAPDQERQWGWGIQLMRIKFTFSIFSSISCCGSIRYKSHFVVLYLFCSEISSVTCMCSDSCFSPAGVPYKTFGYVNINISDADLKKCKWTELTSCIFCHLVSLGLQVSFYLKQEKIPSVWRDNTSIRTKQNQEAARFWFWKIFQTWWLWSVCSCVHNWHQSLCCIIGMRSVCSLCRFNGAEQIQMERRNSTDWNSQGEFPAQVHIHLTMKVFRLSNINMKITMGWEEVDIFNFQLNLILRRATNSYLQNRLIYFLDPRWPLQISYFIQLNIPNPKIFSLQWYVTLNSRYLFWWQLTQICL